MPTGYEGFEFDAQENGRLNRLPASDTRPPPAFTDIFTGAMRIEADRVDEVQDIRRARAYEPLIDALVEQGVDRDSLHHRQPGLLGIGSARGAYDYAAIWREAQRRGIKGIPASRELFEQDALRRQGERDKDQEMLARSSGLSGFAAQLGGGMLGSFADPINVYTLPLGGGGGSITRRILVEGAINAGIEGVQAAGGAQSYGRLGEEYGIEQAAQDVALAGFAGAAFKGAEIGGVAAVRGIGESLPLDMRMARALGKQSLEEVSDADVARAFRQTVPEDLRLPDEVSALHVIDRGVEVESTSPFRNTHAGLAEHQARLTQAQSAIEQGKLPKPPKPGKLDGRILRFLRLRGYGDAQARGIAAGIHAESASDAGAVNPSSGAFGIGQWLGSRKDELFRRYGRNPTLEQQLEFLDWELKGGDHGGAAVRQGDSEEAVLDAYIRKFMRPAEGAETDGDLARGMAALGRDGESIPSTAGASADAAEDAAIASAIDAERNDVEMQRIRAEGESADLAPDPSREPNAEGDAEIDPVAAESGSLAAMRLLVEDPQGPSLNRLGELADELGVAESEIRTALDQLVGSGELRRTQGGTYRRLARPGDMGPEDMLRFIARRGGISYDGLNDAGRAGGTLGHDLRNSGNLDKFVPGAGPLLRPNGRALDEIGEQLHDAGYFGPPETTPRPTDGELITMLDQVIGRGEKRFSFFDQAPGTRGPSVDDLDIEAELEAAGQAAAANLAKREIFDAAGARFGIPLITESDIAEIEALMRGGIPVYGTMDAAEGLDAAALAPYVDVWVNRKIDDALDDAFSEIEDPIYDFIDANQADAETAGARESDQGRTADAGDAGESAAGDGDRQGLSQEPELDPAARDALEADNPSIIDEADPALARFAERDGEGAQAAAESDWHDIRAGVERERTVTLPDGETRGMGVQYHGARGDLPDLSEGYYNPANIYGGFDTFYTTDAVDVALGYQRKNSSGKIYRIDEVEPVNFFDMEARLEPAKVAAFFGIRDWENEIGFPASAIEEATGADGRLNLREAMDEIRMQSRSEEVSRDEVQEIFDNAIHNLQGAGFGGMSHIGGLRIDKAAPHTVKIYFDAPNQIRLTSAEPARQVDPAIAARQAEEARLRAEAPLRGGNVTGQAQDGSMGLELFDAADQPTFDLGDGKPARTAAEIEQELAADRAAIEALKGCMK